MDGYNTVRQIPDGFNQEEYQIGAFCFSLLYTPEIALPPHFQLFCCAEGENQYTYELVCSDGLPLLPTEGVLYRSDMAVCRGQDGLESRFLGVRGQEGYYAFYQDLSKNRARTILLRNRSWGISVDPFFVSLFALEKQMLKRDSLILHCAYLCYRGRAILFSGPSGIGKSTQAGLWEQYRGAELINGDRALLRKIQGQWSADGWPVCGSSGVCRNVAAPIHAVVILERGKENHAVRLSPVQAFAQLYGQITVNQWNREAQTRAVCLLEALIAETPVFLFKCNISDAAVQCLADALDFSQGI